MKAEDILDKFAQDEGFGNWETVVLNCHHSVIRSIAIAAVNQALQQPPVVGQSEQFYCTCSRAKGLDYDEEGMPYCIECEKPVQ